jgi:hypothetical protein
MRRHHEKGVRVTFYHVSNRLYSRSLSIGKVRFDEQQVSEHGGQININLSPDGRHADAHLGFLQVREVCINQLIVLSVG